MSNKSHLGPVLGEGSFDAYYFRRCCGRPYGRDPEWLRFFGTIADRIVADIAPRRVLDAGCAFGLLVEALRSRDVEASGIDVSPFAIAQASDSVRPFCRLGSITEELDGRYDLIVCIEVLEHLSPAEAESALDNLCRHADDILFSSSPVDFKEPTHLNVRPPESWAEQFARRGFFRDVDFDAGFVTPWAVRFRHPAVPIHRIVRDYERWYAAMAIERNTLRSELDQSQRQLVEALSQQADSARLLGQTRDTIRHMEQSWFWRARGLWVWLQGLFR